MKLVLNFLTIAIFSVLLISCKSDDTVTGPGTGTASGSFEWTNSPVTYGFAYDVQVIDRNNYFASTTAGLYKVTNNVPSLFTVNSSVFKARAGYVYDDTYIVYKGNRVSDNKSQLMIYDNGAYTIYDQPDSNLSAPIFESRAKFYCKHYYLPQYYKFESGAFSLFSFMGDYARDISKANGSMYMFTMNQSTYARRIYKITDGAPVFLREEPETGSLYFINNSIININSSDANVGYFTESGWTRLFTLPDPYHNYPSVIKGENSNGFEMVRQDSASKFGAARWNGTSYVKQTNIPAEINFADVFFYLESNFRDNTFYLLLQDGKGSSRIIKGTYKE